MSKPLAIVVDDDAAVARAHARILRGGGYEVEIAANGAIALQALERAAVAVVVSDIDMPEMDGIELLRRMRAQHPHIPVIIVTGDVRAETAARALEHGAVCCMSKPVEPKSMVRAADDAVRSRALADVEG